ncbi:DNA-binding Lrp family transcriptional regulator [Psychromicrobium silvestre]|uniref:DNA-binding Lrp family transcriptional regulator n=1 Tax=Psychromicrobium silvestre TaxID=1645614 RepID=A0A7Y9LS99_9MICC|nr:Lrp/AsnC family transcriptional regulator [Psychromicrobium silvestre]NYE94676.1 DNA-binding Lrp family transcriptional regulator [Psychromicrobium silvestre]
MAVVLTPSLDAINDFLDSKLPSHITAYETVLFTKLISGTFDWFLSAINDEERAIIAKIPRSVRLDPSDFKDQNLDRVDKAILAKLHLNARAATVDIAAAVVSELGGQNDVSARTISRRTEYLVSRQGFRIQCEVLPEFVGLQATVHFWLRFPPQNYREVIGLVRSLPEVRFAYFTPGRTNLFLYVWLGNAEDRIGYESRLARLIPGLEIVESVQITRTYKRTGAVILDAGKPRHTGWEDR